MGFFGTFFTVLLAILLYDLTIGFLADRDREDDK